MNSLILRTTTQLLITILLLFSVFLLLRGHDLPGGGFIGGLVAATSFVVYVMAHGAGAVRAALRIDPRMLTIGGLAAALSAGVIALIADRPLFTGLWAKTEVGGAELPLSTVLLFDIGVYFVVVGGVLTMILTLEEEE